MIKYKSRTAKSTDYIEEKEFAPKQWVQLTSPTKEEIDYISTRAGLEPTLLIDATDIDEMPRFEIEDDKAYLYTRFALKSSRGSIETEPVLFIIGDESFVSLTNKPFEQLENLLETHSHLVTNRQKHLLLSALNVCLQSYANQLAYMGRQIRSARNSLRDEKFSNKHFVRFVEIEDILNDFLSELVPTNNILLNMIAGRKVLKFTEEDLDILEDLQLETAQLIEESKGYLKTIVNIREAYSNIMTNNLNRQIKILTVLTIVLTVPTIVGSFFGMNVDVPLDSNPLAFPLVVGGTLTLAIIVLIYLKHKDWL
ncbi:MAG: magnesium transporter CorA family protein [Patescibacteria group bacterium]|nr:magnesium transporter CorA family protein [Patescibacteria group bacterium]